MIFPKSISIQGSYFGKLTTFSRSIFVGRFNSDSAFFNSTISFDVSEFRKAVFLRKCTFKDDSYFRNITACDAFVATDSSFHGDTFFYLASFSDLTMFDYSIFNDSVRFRGAKFHDTAGFRCAIFNCRKDYTIISFEDCIFYKALSFEDAFFKEYFPIFTGSIFLGIVIFSSLDHRWPREMCKSIDNAKATSAIVRHLLAKQGSPEDAHFFFRREMYFAGQIGSTVQRLPYLIYGWLSDYGYSIKRPAIGLGLVWLFGTAILDTAFQFDFPQEAPLPTAAALSFSNLFPFFGFTGTYFEPGFLRELPAPLKVLSAAQTVLSLPLLFFLGLGLRTRFRMR